MFDDLSDMIHFITLAPWFIFGGFAGSFLLTFTTIKLSQSDTIYDWFAVKMELLRARQATKIRRAIMRDAIQFRSGRDVDQMPDVERKIYFQLLESGWKRIARVYKTQGGNNNDGYE